MARKSRKQNDQMQFLPQKSTFIQTAAYVRLSKEDIAHKGDSIEIQKCMISNYIEEHPDFQLYDTYSDTGASGTTFDRPEFQRMLRDAEAGKINCIIVKDLSRLGRNLIDTGYFTEMVFPSLGVRLIAINDNYDTNSNSNNITIPLIHLMNEAFALDVGKKTKLQARQAMEDGIYVGGRPPYGYIKSSDDRHKLIADLAAADTVRQIFEWASGGANTGEIARKLNLSQIPPPGVHKNQQDLSHKLSSGAGRWYPSTVGRILVNQIYLGRLIQGKTKVVEFRRRSAPSDEWVYVHNAHEAIVSLELFQAAHASNPKMFGCKKTTDRIPYSPNIFKGKIYCAYCGGHLERKKNHEQYIYRCVASRTAPMLCAGNRIKEDIIRQVLFEQLIQYREALVDRLDRQSIEREVLPELQWIEMELSYFRNIMRGLYENLVKGILKKQEYMGLKSGYQTKIDNLNQRATMLTQLLNDEKIHKTKTLESVHILNVLADTMVLTQEHIDRFVEKVVVFRDGKIHVDFCNFHEISAEL